MKFKNYLVSLAALLCLLPTAVYAENVFVENNSSAVFSGEENSGYIGVIRDGRIPDSDVVREQYLAYADGSGIAYIGYKFPETMSANTLIYSPGIADSTGGWFADGDVWIEALYGDVWTEIDAYSTPEYPVITSGDEITTAGIMSLTLSRLKQTVYVSSVLQAEAATRLWLTV